MGSPWRKRDLICLVGFFFLWLIPIFYYGMIGKTVPHLPRSLAHVSRISRLFYWRSNTWTVPYLQASFDSKDQWVTLPEEEYFQMKPFGYRTRLCQLTILSQVKLGKRPYEELCGWVRDRYRQLHPEDTRKLVGIRLVLGIIQPKRKGHIGPWVPPDFGTFQSAEIKVLYESHFSS